MESGGGAPSGGATSTPASAHQHPPPSAHRACTRCYGVGTVVGRYSKKALFKQKQRREARLKAGLPDQPVPPRQALCPKCGGCGLTADPPVAHSPTASDTAPREGRGVDASSGGAGAGEGSAGAGGGAGAGAGSATASTGADCSDGDADDRPLVAVIGGGIGGPALALALQQRGMRVAVFERDAHFGERAQGYGLTMQQGARALLALGFHDYSRLGIQSLRHTVYTTAGEEVGRWGRETHRRAPGRKAANRQNVHITRQQLRWLITTQLQPGTVRWGKKLVDYECADGVDHGAVVGEEAGAGGGDGDGGGVRGSSGAVTLRFADGSSTRAALLVGADGFYSAVRRQRLGEEATPKRYLGVIVVLGIAPCSHPRADLRVFQTADGTTRLYAMPFSRRAPPDPAAASGSVGGESGEGAVGTAGAAGAGEGAWAGAEADGAGADGAGADGAGADGAGAAAAVASGHLDPRMAAGPTGGVVGNTTMWQLSFPLPEEEAARLGGHPEALKAEALRRCGDWHDPIPALLRDTPAKFLCGYPVYDRDLPPPELLRGGCAGRPVDAVTLLGDACHPMSPFKGQGANQALLDAVELARLLHRTPLAPPMPVATATAPAAGAPATAAGTEAGDDASAATKKARARALAVAKAKAKAEARAAGKSPAVHVEVHVGIPKREKPPTRLSLAQALGQYERGMLERSASKVRGSRDAASFLHTAVAVTPGNMTRAAVAAGVGGGTGAGAGTDAGAASS